MIDFIDKASNVLDETKNKWKTEAKRWRLPYWDFARFASHDGTPSDELRLPILATLPVVKVKVFGSENELVNKANPLYKFQTQTLMGDLERPYNITAQRTTRNGRDMYVPVRPFPTQLSFCLAQFPVLTIMSSVREMSIYNQIRASRRLQPRCLGGRGTELATSQSGSE